MNNFELDEKAKQYEDTMTPYALARRIIELEESQNKIKAEAVREAAKSTAKCGDYWEDEHPFSLTSDLVYYANKLERGEL